MTSRDTETYSSNWDYSGQTDTFGKPNLNGQLE